MCYKRVSGFGKGGRDRFGMGFRSVKFIPSRNQSDFYSVNSRSSELDRFQKLVESDLT